MKFYKKIMAVMLSACIIFGTALPAQAALQQQELDYTDALESFDNPERGFYEHCCLHLVPEGGKAAAPTANLVHLRVDISEFSDNAVTGTGNGTSMDITDAALKDLADTFENIRAKGHSVIVRVCYDPYYNGKSNYEPDQTLIIKHLQQLGGVYSQYTDVIDYVELGMYGPWGEMHTSKCCTAANVAEAMNALLAAAPKIKIGVRTPNYVAAWLGISTDDFNVDSDVFKAAVKAKGTDAYRVGMYNDGYLGSSSDLGTFMAVSRENGVKWLNEYATHTLYGGECVASASGGTIGDYNNIDYISKEGFDTHTSYLNISWNYNVINEWKNSQTYTGEDDYNGQTAFKYINDHLGYRFVLRDSDITPYTANGARLKIHLGLENVGFGNITNSKKVTFVLKDESGNTVELAPETDIDACTFLSQQTADINTAVDIKNLSKGKYKVYMRISQCGDMAADNNYKCIRFANSSDYWDKATGSNYIGETEVVTDSITDLDEDGTVTEKDAGLALKEAINGGYNADLNNDGVVDLRDVILMLDICLNK